MTAERDVLATAALDLTEHLKVDPGAVSGHLWCRISGRSTSSSLLFTGPVGEDIHPSSSLSRPVVKALQSSGLFDGRVIELSFDRSGGWESVTTVGDPRKVVIRPITWHTPVIDPPEMNDAEREELRRVWVAGVGDYEITGPASERQLAELAVSLGQPVPPQLVEVLRLSDGAAVSSGDEELDWHQTMTGGWGLLTTNEIATEHANWAALAAEGHYDGVAYDLGKPGATALRLVHPGWIPFARDWGGNHLAVDTVPGSTGVAGQVLEFGRDLPDGPLVRADSIVDFLAGRRHEWPSNPDRDTMVKPEESRPLLPADVPATCQSLRLFGLTQIAGETAARAVGLKSLIIRDAESVDLAGMANLPLQDLRLLDLKGIDLSPLAGHPALRRLRLENIDAPVGVAALGELRALESVSFAGPVAGELVEAVARNPHLHRVTFDRDLPLAEAIAFADALRPDSPVEVTRESGPR